MGGRIPTRRLLVGLAVVVLLAGCASGATPPPSPTAAAPTEATAPSVAAATPTVTATPTPTATPAPTPVARVTVTVVGSTAQVPAPNGSDDTATIQAALDACVKHGPGCTVQLGTGTYKTRQLVARNFQGTFKGAGVATTTIEALPALSVNVPDFLSAGECVPNLTDCLWPSLIVFVDGTIAVSDLAIHATATDGQATAPWTIGGSSVTSLIDALRFMGQHSTAVTVDRVAIEGRHDTSVTSLNGYNLVNGILYAGELPRSSTPFDYYTLNGSFVVRASSFTAMDSGVGADGFLASVKGTIGGSAAAANQFADVHTGIGLQTAQGSVFDVSYNTASAAWAGLAVSPWQPAFMPSSTSQYRVHDNTFLTSASAAPGAEGIYLRDDPTHPWLQATVSNNAVKLQVPLNEGIEADDTIGTVISGNTVSGTADFDAISLYGASKGSVSGNHVSGLAVNTDPGIGLAQIYLDPATAALKVACAGPSDTVANQGTGNTVVGCHAVTSSAPGHEGSPGG